MRPASKLPKRQRFSLWRIQFPWVCMTPLGSAVVPDVYTSITRSAGVTSASMASKSSSLMPGSTAPGAGSMPRWMGVAHGLPMSPTVRMLRR